MGSHGLRLPDETQQRLKEFQRHVRKVKLAEGVLAGLFGLAVSYIAVFVLDRLIDTPAVVRTVILVSGCLGFGLFFPLKCHRWVWRTRQMSQVAKLLKHRFPALGDQLMGVVDLAGGRSDLGTSETLARAAVAHVNETVKDRDLRNAVPNPRQKSWAITAGIPLGLTLAALLLVPAAGSNAFKRWLMPWVNVDRYTFAQVDGVPDRVVVPHGETFEFTAQLSESSEWSPRSGSVRFDNQDPVQADLDDRHYDFVVPPQTETGTLNLRIGDLRESVDVEVAARPELNSIRAQTKLPDYLQYSRDLEADVRGGVISLVKGSVAQFVADISRALQTATVEGQTVETEGARIVSKPVPVNESETLKFQWKDELGLTSKDGFQLKIKAVDDKEPGITFQQLDAHQVILTSDVVSFDVQSSDDFGLQEIGLEWQGLNHLLRNPNPKIGEKIVSGGSPELTQFSGQATFCAATDNVPAQSLRIRAYAVDYKPERERSYSPGYVLHVLTPEDHAIWIMNQLRRWASLADDVYEEEMRLHDANRELRRMSRDEINLPGTRKRIERQAAAERANGQRLGAVTDRGERLIQQALRNKEMLVGHLETWADALEALKQIGEKRMPSVADLLDSAAKAPGKKIASAVGEGKTTKPSPTAGNNRNQTSGSGKSSESKKQGDQPAIPRLTDIESGFNKPEADDEDDAKQPPKKPGGKFGLPSTVLKGGPKPKRDSQPPPPAQQKVDEAVEEQADLLAEFAKVRDELQKIMDDLEGSTFVKRFKAASRRQLEVAEDLNRTLFKGFGVNSAKLDKRQENQFELIARREEAQSQSVWFIQSDLEAYYDRRRSPTFLRILEEMRELNVTKKLDELGVRVRRNMAGEAIARSEFWGDTLDRWAEELVQPSNCGSCPGGSSDSLPPFIVLEVMRILEGEMDLRDETRATEQSREAIERKEYDRRAAALAETQDGLHIRMQQVLTDIRSLPDGEKKFGKELQLLQMAASVMAEATGILSEPNTGPTAIAAETEVIELLLQAKRCNPNGGGGGGGSSPGGGGGGDTDQVALALYGPGSDLKAQVEQRGVEQATGTTGSSLPAEFRDGLEAFFDAVESVR